MTEKSVRKMRPSDVQMFVVGVDATSKIKIELGDGAVISGTLGPGSVLSVQAGAEGAKVIEEPED